MEDSRNEELWHRILNEGEPGVRFIRRVFRRIPSNPRCRMCFGPFKNVGGRILSVAGFGPSRKNPLFCNR